MMARRQRSIAALIVALCSLAAVSDIGMKRKVRVLATSDETDGSTCDVGKTNEKRYIVLLYSPS